MATYPVNVRINVNDKFASGGKAELNGSTSPLIPVTITPGSESVTFVDAPEFKFPLEPIKWEYTNWSWDTIAVRTPFKTSYAISNEAYDDAERILRNLEDYISNHRMGGEVGSGTDETRMACLTMIEQLKLKLGFKYEVDLKNEKLSPVAKNLNDWVEKLSDGISSKCHQESEDEKKIPKPDDIWSALEDACKR